MNLQIEREDKRNLKENIQTLKTSPTRERLRKILGMLRAHHLVVVEHQKFFSTAYPAVLARCTTEELAHGGSVAADHLVIFCILCVLSSDHSSLMEDLVEQTC